MTISIENIKAQLQDQLEGLVKKIQTLETELAVSKEGFLKVQGALEILNVLEEQQGAADAQPDQPADED